MANPNGNPDLHKSAKKFKSSDDWGEPLAKTATMVKLPQSIKARVDLMEDKGAWLRQAIAAAIAPGDNTPSSNNYSPGGFPLPPWPLALVMAVDSTMLRKMAAHVGVSSRGDGGKQKSKDQLIAALRDGGYLL